MAVHDYEEEPSELSGGSRDEANMVDLRDGLSSARLVLSTFIYRPDLAVQWHSPSRRPRHKLFSGTTRRLGDPVTSRPVRRGASLLASNNAWIAQELQARGSWCIEVFGRPLR